MLFNSDVFLFLFLPLTLTGYYLLGRCGYIRASIALVIIASLTYYAWWNPAYLPLILGSMAVNYSVGFTIQKNLIANKLLAKTSLITGIVFNLGLLGYFKYANFFVDNLSLLSDNEFTLAPIVLPLAISFFTFQQIAYLVDVYQNKASEANLIRYALFVTFFPQLIAGPIVHHKEMMPQFADKSVGLFQLNNLIIGCSIFFIGMFKKVVLADNVAPFATAAFNSALSGGDIGFTDAWVGALAYTCQIYFDFSGYSDMAVGLARMFGINLPLNFNSPYKATGIIEFWRRWHMTLSRFLRDYLYFPLGGNRLGPNRRYINMLAVMLLGGLWHGAGWNFVVWGGLHGLYLGINHGWRAWRGERLSTAWPARAASCALTFIAVVVAWVFFRAESYAAAISILRGMTDISAVIAWREILIAVKAQTTAISWITALLLMSWALPNTQQFMRRFMSREFYKIESPAWLSSLVWKPKTKYALCLALISAITVMSLWQPSEFIYYQF
jgi:alginate O-acetyltransferase complex protein AlgI